MRSNASALHEMSQPFATFARQGVRYVDSNADQAFRKALMAGVPVALRSKMQLALTATPNPAKDIGHSQRYFGDRLQDIADRSKPLVDALDTYMATKMSLPGFRDWMIVTGYTNHYRMIVVFDEWSRTRKLDG